MSWQDTSSGSIDCITQFYTGLMSASAALTSGAIHIQLDNFQKQYNNQSCPTVTIVPRSIEPSSPLENCDGETLQTEKQNIDLQLWATNYDSLNILRSFTRTVGMTLFKGWMEFREVENEEAEGDHFGRTQVWRTAIYSQLPQYTPLYSSASISSLLAITDSPPIANWLDLNPSS